MQRWSAFILSGMLGLAVVVGLFIEPSDSQANLNTATWYATYYDNTDLSGDPVLSRNEREINYNWAENPPSEQLPDDGFSARWNGSFFFETGTWQFSVGADDGVRLWINGEQLINHWLPNDTYTVQTVTREMQQGIYDIRLEYFDASGTAGLVVQWEPVPESGEAENATTRETSEASSNPQSDPIPGNPVGHIAAGTLNVRSGPGISYDRIEQVYLYQQFPIRGVNEGASWYMLDLKDGRMGWVSARYLYITGSTDNVPVIDVAQPNPAFSGIPGEAVANLVIRSQATSNSARLGVVPEGSDITIIGRNSASAWYEMRYDDISGWVYAPAVRIGNPVYDIPFSTAAYGEAASQGEVFDFSGATGVTLDYIRLRTLPSTLNSEIILNVPVGTELEILGRSANSAWYLVNYEGESGWVAALYVELQDGVRPFNVPFAEQ